MTGLTRCVAIPGDAALCLRQRSLWRAGEGDLDKFQVAFSRKRNVSNAPLTKRNAVERTSRAVRRVLAQLDRALVYGTKGFCP